MCKRDCRMVMKPTEESMSIEPAETGDVSGAGAPERFWVQIKKVPLSDVSLQAVPVAVNLKSRDR